MVESTKHTLPGRLGDAYVARDEVVVSCSNSLNTEDMLMGPRLIRMSPEGFRAFVADLNAPTTPVPEMAEVLRRPAPWEAD